jgi:predicted negative regulator of RcsB-dependent stress response
MRKKIIIALILIAALGIVGYNYMYKSHRDISAEDVAYSETVPQVFDAFAKNDSLANAKYLDKTIEIYGKITNIDLANKTITVDEKLTARCTNSIPNNLKVQNTVTLKGRVVGYDDLVEEIQMDQCTIKQ